MSLTTGGIININEYRKEVIDKFREETRRPQEIRLRIEEIAKKAYEKEYGEAAPGYKNTEEYYEIFERVIEKNQDDWKEMNRLQYAAEARERERTYRDIQTEKEIHVGREGTLIYRLASGEIFAHRMRYETQKAKHEYTLAQAEGNPMDKEYWDKYLDGDKPETAEVLTFLEESKNIAYLLQIEVLREAQGKGIAKALLEAGYAEMQELSGADGVVAIVLESNPDRRAILHLFEKDGFRRVFCPGDGSQGGNLGGEGPYYLLVKRFSPHPDERKEKDSR